MCWSTGGATGMAWGHNCNCPNCTCGGSSVNVDFTVSGWPRTDGTFEWALQEMRQGRKVRRKIWPIDSYVYLRSGEGKENDDLRTVGQINEIGTETSWMTHSHHLLATDWELYEKKCGECGRPTS